jgi:hypothetical protein
MPQIDVRQALFPTLCFFSFPLFVNVQVISTNYLVLAFKFQHLVLSIYYSLQITIFDVAQFSFELSNVK